MYRVWRAPSQELEGRRHIFSLGGDAVEVVLVRRWLLCSVVCVAGTPFHCRALRSVLSRVLAASLAS